MQNLLEQIEIIRERANVTYAEAKEALELCNYDIVETLVHLEKQNKVNTPSQNADTSKTVWAAIKDTVKSIIRTGNDYKFVIKKSDNIVINIPVTILFLAIILFPPIMIGAALLALFTKHTLRFEKSDGGDVNVNEALEKVSAVTGAVGDKVTAALNK